MSMLGEVCAMMDSEGTRPPLGVLISVMTLDVLVFLVGIAGESVDSVPEAVEDFQVGDIGSPWMILDVQE